MFKQKRAELLRASILIALLVLTVGIIFVYSANVSSSPQVSNPNVTKASINATLNFTITVSANGDTVQRVDINKPASYTVFNCPVLVPAGWTCDKTSATVISYTDAVTGITAGNSAQFGVNATSGAASGNVTWTINTYENTGGTVDQNNTLANTTVDGDGPVISSLNLTAGSLVLLLQNLTNATYVAKKDLVINVTIISSFAPIGLDKVAIYLNITNETTFAARGYAPHPDNAFSYKTVVQMSNTTLVNPSTGRFNGTISSTLLYNGSIVTFVIVSNDTIGNQNVTNGSVLVETFTSGFNVTVDDAPPLATVPSGKIINDVFDAAADNITTSTQIHNFTVNVADSGGSGVYSVWINVSNTLRNMTDAAGNTWNISDTLQGLGLPAGDQNVTVYFLVNDSVGNINTSFGFNLLVDDNDFAAVVTSNTTSNFTTSNRTIINITATLNINLNLTAGSNVTIHGPNTFRFNMTRRTVTARWGGVGTVTGEQLFQSTWFSSIHPQNQDDVTAFNGTWSNLSDFGCGLQGVGVQGGDNGNTCTLQISWNDLFGRPNSTNITITVDNIPPRIVNITVQNASDINGPDINGSGRTLVVKYTDFLNFTVNSENNVVNVTIHNSTIAGSSTNATLMGSGGDRNFSIQLQVTAAGTGSGLCRTEGLCTINFSAVDNALNLNRSGGGQGTVAAASGLSSVSVIVDDSAPLLFNITIANITGKGGVSGNGNASVFPGSGAVWTVKRSAILNFSINASDAYSNITLLSAANSSGINFSVTTTNPWGSGLLWNARNASSEFCGIGANVEVECNLWFTAKDNVSNTNSSSVNLSLRVDDLTPRVYNFSTKLALNHIANSLSTVIFFEANITDANLLNVSLYAVNATSSSGYNLLVMNKSQSGSSNSTSIEWNASYTLTQLGCDNPSGNCTVVLNATDVLFNANNTVNLSVQATAAIPNVTGISLSATRLNNVTKLTFSAAVDDDARVANASFFIDAASNGIVGMSPSDGSFDEASEDVTYTLNFANYALTQGVHRLYIEANDSGSNKNTQAFTTFTINNSVAAILNISPSGTLTTNNSISLSVNTSTAATCRYNVTSSSYDVMGSTSNLGPTSTTNHTATLFSAIGEVFDKDPYTFYIKCRGDGGSGDEDVSETVSFSVDTRNNFNVTIPGATYGSWPNYFEPAPVGSASGWTSFVLSTGQLASTSLVSPGTYNVTNVLNSLMTGTAAGKFNKVLAYTASTNSWQVFVVGGTANTFINFTNQTTYWINITAKDRIEIN